jgi:hypothetical protein
MLNACAGSVKVLLSLPNEPQGATCQVGCYVTRGQLNDLCAAKILENLCRRQQLAGGSVVLKGPLSWHIHAYNLQEQQHWKDF